MPYSLISAIYLFFVVILFMFPARPLADADSGWHVMSGHEILAEGQVPEHDSFSFTSTDYQWFNLSWLWDVFAALLDSVGGLYLLSAFTIILGGATLALLTWFTLNRGAGTVATMFAVTFGIFGFMPALLVRPHQFTNIFTLLFCIILYFYAKDPAKSKKLFFLPLIMLFWANIHGGFFTGFTIIAAYFLQFIYMSQKKAAKTLFLFGALTFAAVFFNPLGVDIFEAAYRTLGGLLKVYISEWRSPADIRDFIFIIFFVVVFVPTFKIHSIADKLICLFWLAETMLAVRNLPIFMIVSVPVIASGMVHIGGRFQIYREREHDYTTQFSSRFLNRFLPLLAVCLSLIFLTPQWSKIVGFKPDSTNYPKEEIDFLIRKYPEARLFNHYDYGGYVIYESKGKLKTFIDGRAETAYSPAVVKDYLDFDTAASGWENVISKYDVDAALMPKNLGIQLDYFERSPEWRKVHTGKRAVVYVRVIED